MISYRVKDSGGKIYVEGSIPATRTRRLLNSQGESMKTIQAQLRHSSARVTMEICTHAIPQHQRDAVERLERRFGPNWTQIQESDEEDAPLIH